MMSQVRAGQVSSFHSIYAQLGNDPDTPQHTVLLLDAGQNSQH